MAKHSVNVVVAAGGSGTRYGKQNKLLEPCGVSCVLIEAIKPFLARKDVTRVIVAIDTGASDEFLDALEAAGLDDDRRIIMTRGGATRPRAS